jgi:hypothetical protein
LVTGGPRAEVVISSCPVVDLLENWAVVMPARAHNAGRKMRLTLMLCFLE